MVRCGGEEKVAEVGRGDGGEKGVKEGREVQRGGGGGGNESMEGEDLGDGRGVVVGGKHGGVRKRGGHFGCGAVG